MAQLTSTHTNSLQKNRLIKRGQIFVVLLLLMQFAAGQDTTRLAAIVNSPDRVYKKLEERATQIDLKIENATEKYIKKLEKQEDRLRKKLSKIDSLEAKKVFDGAKEKYQSLSQSIKEKTSSVQRKAKQYLPFFDSLKTSIKFLDEHKELLGKAKESSTRIKEAMGKLNAVDDRLQQAENIRQFIKERRALLKAQLSKYGLGKDLAKFNKQAYYYSQQIQEYKSILNQPEKLMQKSIGLLSKLPAFRDFMSKYSELASLFAVPNTGAEMIDNAALQALQLAGLQTQSQVQQQIQNSIGTNGNSGGIGQMDPQALIQQNLRSAQAELSKLKNRITQQNGGANDELEMPEGFKPNTQKTKTFLKRLEYGTNIQSQKSSYFFPTTTDVGLSIGYKINDKSIIGIGTSFKMGWGQSIRNIQISAEGLSLRSFIDVKIRGSFYISGGYEQNYRAKILNIQQFREAPDNWSSSGLIGMSKIISLKSKFFKKTKLQLLWDFMSYQQRPVEQPLKFRVGYNF